MNNAPTAGAANTHQESVVRYSYFSSQAFRKYQARGMEIQQESMTSITKSFDSNFQRLNTVAPSTFRTPISLTRCSAMKEARPNNPRQEIKTASTAKKPAR